MLTIVVARYNESIDWINGTLNNRTKCIIYNKGPKLDNHICPIIYLPNVGREGHTYLYHIINNYDNLSEYTMFLQGYPFDHTPCLESILASDEWKKPFHTISAKKYNLTINKEQNLYTMLELYKSLFNRTKTEFSLWFGAGAQFCVSRSTIRTRPKEFYEQISAVLAQNIDPIEGHAIERFWPMIFLGENLEERSI